MHSHTHTCILHTDKKSWSFVFTSLSQRSHKIGQARMNNTDIPCPNRGFAVISKIRDGIYQGPHRVQSRNISSVSNISYFICIFAKKSESCPYMGFSSNHIVTINLQFCFLLFLTKGRGR